MSDKIQFDCPYCGTQLAVGSQYAGQKAQCPGCNGIVPVPDVPLPPADDGIPTENMEETAPYSAPFSPLSSGSLSSGSFSSGSISSGRGTNESPSSRPASQSRDPSFDETNQFGESRPATSSTQEPSTFGRSFLGLLAGILVGILCAMAWLAVILIFQIEFGILAWGIGALIGLVAGSIAKNPSGIYCFLVACIAGISILSSKLIMVAFLMIVSFGIEVVEDLQNQFLSNKFEHAYVDQQLAENNYPPEKTKLAESFNRGYFEQTDGPKLVINGREIGGFNGNIDAADQSMNQFRREIRDAVAKASKTEKLLWIENARKRHPDWIMDTSHAIAAKILFLHEDGQLDDDLKRQAEFEIQSSDYLLQSADEQNDYLMETPEEIAKLRSGTLRNLVIEKLRDLNLDALTELTKKAATKEPTFVADEHGFIAVLDELLANGELLPELREHAMGRVKTVTDSRFSATFFSTLGEKAFIEKEIAIRKIAMPIWAASTPEQIEAKIAETKLRHPKWDPDQQNPQVIASEEFKEEIGDGSLAGSIKKVFSLSDLLWLSLGFISAFGTARSRADRTN